MSAARSWRRYAGALLLIVLVGAVATSSSAGGGARPAPQRGDRSPVSGGGVPGESAAGADGDGARHSMRSSVDPSAAGTSTMARLASGPTPKGPGH